MGQNEIELICELSPMQQAMLFSSLYAPGSGVYVVQVSLRLTGRLNVPVFEESWKRMVARHGALRTGFHWEDLEKPLQAVLDAVEIPLRRESWRHLSREEQEARLREELDADREAGFTLSEPPLMRLALFDLGPSPEGDAWHLVWSLHHLLVDGWSVGLLLKELFTCYAELAAGREPRLPELRSTYGDYIEWLARQDAAATEAFWRRSLAGLAAPTLAAGGGGKSRGAAGFRRTGRRGLRLGGEATAALRELARRELLTVNTLLQGAWALVLAAQTGGSEVVFGGTVAGRPGDLPGADAIVGLFINTLPVRVAVPSENDLLPWLRALQAEQAEARRFEHAPLYEVQTWSELPAGTPLFDSILVFESYPLDGALAGRLPDLALSRVTMNEQTDLPLNLVVLPGAELSLELLHDTERVDVPGAVRLLERLAAVLCGFVADPGCRLGDLPRLLEGERQQVLAEWNDTASAFPSASVPELFAAVAAAQPEAPAVVEGEEVWSYARLDAAASRLAEDLAARGVAPGDRVGVEMDRSAGLVVAFLAVLKAGAAYVPLDPGYPEERRALMREDTGAAVVLTNPHPLGGAGVPAPQVLPDALAYVIFTSGSTGRPKGVAVPHRAIVRLVRETDYVQLAPGDRVAHLSNTSFDAATFEIWGALLNGATIVIVPRDVALVPEAFADLLRRERVTSLFLTTALFNQMVRTVPGAFDTLREVLFGGEAVDPGAVARAAERPGPARLLHVYGPTESTTFATWHRVRAVAEGETTVPIGLPLAATTAYVVDADGRLVPPGTAGELWIGGDGLAWGYWNRPELSAERFVPHPWARGERLYRTGDLVRQRPGGAIEFLGRIDGQVKIRGFRIEPGEIEAVLLSLPGVRECAVVAREEPGGRRLVAYVAGEAAPAVLRDFLRERLPEYMVPAAWVALEALPINPNGKVDRKALPAPEEVRTEEEAPPPGDPVEELLAGIWSAVLGCERVGPHDDFFALGGHSLLATQVASRIRAVLGVELPLRSVFEEPTVAGLARLVRSTLAGAEAPPITRREGVGAPPVSFAQQRLWLIDRLAPGNPGYNIPLAVRLTGELSVPRLAAAFAAVVARHEALRTTFAVHDGEPVQVIAPHWQPPLPVVDLAGLPGQSDPSDPTGPTDPSDAFSRQARQALALARAEALHPFDLVAGPLLRAVLVRLAPREHLLLLTLHHIITDGWSMGILVRELQAFHAGETLAELPVQYADFSVWQRRWLAGGVLERQLAWWREQLAGTTGVLELPTDHPRPAVLSLRGAEHRFTLDRELAGRLTELGRREGATPYMILAAALFALLGRLSGQRDLNLGSPIANRNRIETEGLIGFFVNTLVLRADLGLAATFLDLLVQVREASLGAYAHQDLPFEKLVDEIQPERDLSRSPLVQVALAVNNAPLPRAEVHGLALTPETPPAEVAKFDLAFIFAPVEDGALAASLQYARDLWEAPTAVRLTRQLAAFLEALTAAPEERLADLSPLTAAERHQVLCEWNDTAEARPAGPLLHDLFAAQVAARPQAPAAVWEGTTWSYRELAERAWRLAAWLRHLGVRRGTPVGVWMERSLDMVAGVLGILEAGGTYVPLDAAWPADRVETILAGTGAPVILTGRATLPAVEKLRWRLPRLNDAICLDIAAADPGPEAFDEAAIRSLFDFVAERATDRVTAGGFVSRRTGAPFSEAEVDEYRDRVLALAAPWLHPGARVLEVGCGSGLILWEMAPRVAQCVGLDPSERTQERNREHARAAGLDRVELPVGFAHEIGGRFAPGSFDLVLFASTVQFFPGPRYLEKVMAEALALLAPGGAVVLADLIDARQKPAAETLAVDEEQLRGLGSVEILHRTEGFANELGERYDAILRPGPAVSAKRLWTGWHVEQTPAHRLPAVGSPEDIAYVIHTSGSTGLPKGIAVQHAPAVNLIHWVNRTLGMGPEDRLLFVTSLCFDLSVWDLFGTLAAGGTVHVASEAALREPAELVRLLRTEPITIWDSAPAALQQLAPLFPEGEPRPLRLVMLSGDWIPVPLPDQVRAAFPGCRVISLGGATEATVWSNWYPVETVDPRWPSIPYGRPIANARYHALDAALLPCPIGVSGDLYIGGDCLCVGYTGQPELTAAAFVPDPFATEPGARLYRTGDRVRFFRDGNLEFLGRVDQQVKVRGYRIELGEIEVALLRHPEVREAVVLVVDGRLVAWVVPGEGGTPTAEDLHAWLAASLPAYMVPSAFVPLLALPVTANGKLDRKALPAPELSAAVEYEAPDGPEEEGLAALWCEILGLERVGARDNFFSVGGNSLLATQLISQLPRRFGAELGLRELFEAPTLAELARVVRRARRAPAEAAPAVVAGPVPRPAAAREEAPLSFAQQRLWLVDQLDPGTPAYNVPVGMALSGAVEPAVLQRVLAELVRRHETLRTTFVARPGGPVQRIAPHGHPPLPLVDLAGLAGRAEEQAEALARAEASCPFDLEAGPLLRALLVRLEPREHRLLLTLHHIVSDGWSIGLLIEELVALYAALARGAASPLPELPVQYADFALWQRRWLAGDVLEQQLAWWREQLAGAPQVLELPASRPRPAVPSARGAAAPLSLAPDLSAAVRALAHQEGATPFMVLLAAWAVLLGRHAGQDDLLVGSPVAGRNRPEIEGLIGFFVNTLALRVRFSGAPGFRAVLAAVREMALGAFSHQDLPFERLVEELAPGRDLSRSPLVQALFVLQNLAVPHRDLPGLVLRPLPARTAAARFELSLSLNDRPEGFAGVVEHSTDLFDGETARRLAARFLALLEGALAEPGGPVDDLPLLLPMEREQVLHTWNDTARPYPRDAGLAGLFAAVARARPDAPAVIPVDGEAWTYRRLAAAAGRLARHLRRLGVGAESPVGVSMERSPELIVSLLAIVQAGGAYVPFDPGHPAERLDFVRRDTGVRLVLVPETGDQASRREGWVGVSCLPVGPWVEEPEPGAQPAGEEAAGGDRLAYVLYTSGSTGIPKGVAVSHRAVVRLVRETDYLRFAPDDRIAHLSNTSFDAATFEIWGALLNGAALVVVPRETVLEPAALAALLRSERVTSAFVTSALFNQVVRQIPDAFSTVRDLLVGGDAVDPGAAARVLEHGAPERLLNVYGPTESTTFATWHPIREVPPGTTLLPIGQPIAHTTAWVLDRGGRPVPPGVHGELFLGGDGLARGYWNRPELTADRFVLHPWGDGERLYRTGDRVRRRLDGPLEILGRLDRQVKIRGFRIEPGETEAVLAGHPDVREVVVQPLGETPGDRRLAAWIVLRPEATEESPGAALRAWLLERLPDYMIPADWMFLPALPLTANGKVDRRALPLPQRDAVGAAAAPADPVEKALVAIWQDVLECDGIGVHDDFFALGGQSLLATQVVARVREQLRVELPLRAIFEAPVLSALAALVRRAPAAGAGEVEAGGAETAPLSFSQQRLWFLDQLTPGNLAYLIPFAVRLSGELSVAALERTFAEVVRRHATLRTTFQARGGSPVQVIAPPDEAPAPEISLLDLSDAPEEAREEWADELVAGEVSHPFDLTRGPLLRLALLRFAEQEHLLLVTFHHIVSDGWSLGVLLREVGALYPAFLAGEPSPLPELPLQYADYARWQRAPAQQERLADQLSWWRRHLAGAPPVLELPLDRPRPEAPTHRALAVTAGVAAERLTALHELCRQAGATPFMLLLAAWASVLGRLAGQSEVLTGSPVAGRVRREVEPLIGFFVNTLVLRTDLGRAASFRALLAAVRRTTLDAFAHQDLPFERLVEELVPDRDLAVAPLIQVLFALQNAPLDALSLPGLTLAVRPLSREAAPFDLSLALQERADGLAATLEGAAELFDRATVDRFLGGFLRLLAAAVEDPDRPLGALPLLSPAERELLLTGPGRPSCDDLGLFEHLITLLGGVEGQTAPASARELAADTALYVLDASGELAPPGSRGTLYVGGPGVARGTLHRPELTAARFLPDPFGAVPGGRLFRTDLPVRLRPGGEIERLDLAVGDRAKSGRRRGSSSAHVPPRDRFEVAVAAIWREVLKVDRVGAHDNFFALGGHSLLATQVVARLRENLGVQLPLRRLFEVPTLARLAGEVRSAGSAELAAEPIPAQPITAEAPLSFSQQRLWLLDQLAPGSTAYLIPSAIRLTGPLSIAALESTFAEIVRRHAVLRTTFCLRDGRPVQVIAPPGAAVPELQILDLSEAPEEAREEWAREVAAEEARHPFDLATGPLLRLGLLRLGEQDHLLLLTFHHIVSDGWSTGVLLQEVGALYPAFLAGEPSPLPELPIQYADFARWQRDRMQGERLDRELAWWKERLAGAPAVLDLPTDRPRPAVQTWRGATLDRSLSPQLSARLDEVCRQEGVTPFMLLLAAWALVLGRHAGQDDVMVGSPIAGRSRREVEPLIGFFVNTLVLRIDLGRGSRAFRELLAPVRETALEAFAHQDLPFERLVEELLPERDLAVSPLFQVMFAVQNAPREALDLQGLTLAPFPVAGSVALFDLSLALAAGPAGWTAALSYAADLFDPATAERLLDHFFHLLEGVLADPGAPLDALSLMGEDEVRWLTAGLNHHPTTWARPEATVAGLFAGQAARTPGKVAAADAGEELTFQEIAELSAALAGGLRARLAGLPFDRCVGLLADPGPRIAVGLLGILQAGCAVLPLDPQLPDDRLAWMLADASCEVLLAGPGHLVRAEGLAGAAGSVRHVLGLDEVRAPGAGPAAPRDPRAAACVVYTSGSTGRPKGVQVAEESLVPMLLWGISHLGLGTSTRALRSLSFCFDFGIFELLTTLLAGGTLFEPGEAAGDPAACARAIGRLAINTLHTTPAFAREIAAAGEPLDSLEVLHLGGEALSHDTADALRAAAPRAALYNGYGPTEATINSSIFRVDGGEAARCATVPIGRPSADNALYVLDRAGRLAPRGGRGELYVGGLGVARGYLRRPDLTADRFVPDPFGNLPGARLYRTGDLVRLLPEGDLEFLGRVDHQVKLRGFRIELGEIEAALCSHPDVHTAVCQVVGEGTGRRLAAWIVPRREIAEPGETLTAWLRERLPEYMLPTAWAVLAALPLTAQGKVDRKALPVPDRGSPSTLYVAPADALEEAMTTIFQDVLRVERVGVHDNFFTLGGHSLLATQVIARVRQTLGVSVPLRRFFEAPTVARFTQAVREATE